MYNIDMDLTQDELNILRKINFIKFNERTKQKVVEVLEGVSPEVFTGLLSKGILFEYEKEGQSLMGIDKNYFSQINKKESLIDKLFEDGFFITEDKREMHQINNELIENQKQEQVKGIKSFDGKLYVITLEKFSEAKPIIEKILTDEMEFELIHEQSGLEKGLCKAVLEVIKESGEIIEKSKDVFKRI